MTHPDSSSSQATPEADESVFAPDLDAESEQGKPNVGLGTNGGLTELRAMEMAYGALEVLDESGRIRALKWLAETLNANIFQHRMQPALTAQEGTQNRLASTAEAGRQIAPREFISQKRPESLVERVACLAYYLTRYRNLDHFKTSDIVALNTEAAAHKFGNPSRDVDNADRHNGYLVSAGNGKKQLTVRGEAVVEALPDREAVRSALKEHPHKLRRTPGSARKTKAPNLDPYSALTQ